MKKLAFGALIVGLMSACGGNGNKNKIQIVDSGGGGDGSGSGACNVLTQTGCAAGQKCTWFEDDMSMPPIGHIGCAPDGTVAVGGACSYGMPGATGYDNCQKGSVCEGKICKSICDQSGGMPMCPTNFGCTVYSGLFGPANGMVAAGVCDPTCDPLADNKFGSGNTASGSACATGQGCYGEPDNVNPTEFTCSSEVNNSLYHRASCTMANGCAPQDGSAYLNGCASGFIPLLYADDVGNMQILCISMCAPASCYQGNCGTASANLIGASPHRCNNTDSSGTFNSATASNNGDQCMYSWLFELDSNGMLVRSTTSDTVGFCVDHSKYHYDSNADGSITQADANWPKCDTFTSPGFGTGSATNNACTIANGCIGAADFGCVDTTTGSVMFKGKAHRSNVLVERPRPMYHASVRM